MTGNNSNKSPRFFKQADRRAAFIAANGLCVECGKPLTANFHADHKQPYSKGGETTLDNIQALCPECNLKKGSKIDIWTPKNITLRDWQKDAFDECVDVIIKGSPVLIQATPGAGKTIFACSIARYLRDTGRIDRVLVVSPLASLKKSWADDMSLFGIELDPDCGNGAERTNEFHGKSTTYQSLAGNGADVERVLQNRNDTLVVLDEVHHAGDNCSWGMALQQACKNARAILCLSGTPFRSDGKPIPFIKYNEDGQAAANYVYGYSKALTDKPQVCRAVYFPSYEGSMEWLSKDQIYKASFSDALDENMESVRLRAAIQSGEWVRSTLNAAKTKLADIRSTHPDAAGLVVAMDKNHAEYVAKILKSITSSEPLVVTSDDPEAEVRIREFRTKSDPWIIAVKMVSEGVDIKRLRVCVYLSNVITELFFRQVVGRIVRYIPGVKDQEAFFYIPADQRLVEMAKRFQEERTQALLQEAQETAQAIEEQGSFDEFIDMLPRDFSILAGKAWHDQTITYAGDTFSPQEIEDADAFAKQYGYPVAPEVMAKMLRDHPAMRGTDAQSTHSAAPNQASKPAYEKYKEVREATREQEQKHISDLINRWLSTLSREDAYRKVHGGLNRALGLEKKSNATHEQVKRRYQLLLDAVASSSRPAWL